jgi:exopolysaccharide biosynthesis polyprenyl glycosylphosphotransferase
VATPLTTTFDPTQDHDGYSSGGNEAPRGNLWLRRLLVLSDAIGITFAWLLTSATMVSTKPFFSFSRAGFLPVVLAVHIAAIAGAKLYKARVCSVRAVETATLIRACFAGGIGTWLIAGRLQTYDVRLTTSTISAALIFTFIMAFRTLYRAGLANARSAGRYTRPVLIVGTGDEAYELEQMMFDEPELGYRVIGVVGRAHEVTERHFTAPYLGAVADVVDICRAKNVTGVIIGSSSLGFRELNQTVRILLDAGIHVQVSGGLLGFNASRLRSNPIGREAAFYLEQVQLSGWQARVKRALDLAIGTVALIVSAPVMAVIAFIIRRDGGKAIFKQQRVGHNGVPFTVYKLRTMVMNAESLLEQLQKQNERTGPLFKMKDDPRFTRIGKFLDATSLNELPQLFNVLKGNMSLVGPRPALQREVEQFNDRLLLRHRVKPGMTGLWQVESRDNPSFADYERCDVFYVENWSVRLDLMIMAQTFVEVGKRAAGKSSSNNPEKAPQPVRNLALATSEDSPA